MPNQTTAALDLTHGPAIRARHAAGEDVAWLINPGSYEFGTSRGYRCRVTGEDYPAEHTLTVRLPSGAFCPVTQGSADHVEAVYLDRIGALA